MMLKSWKSQRYFNLSMSGVAGTRGLLPAGIQARFTGGLQTDLGCEIRNLLVTQEADAAAVTGYHHSSN